MLTEKSLAAVLRKRGIRIDTSSCGCCDGAQLIVELDGEVVFDETSNPSTFHYSEEDLKDVG